MSEVIVMDRNELLTEESTTEAILAALPDSFRFVCDYSCLRSGRLIAQNGHATVLLQYDGNDDLVMVIQPNENAIARKAAHDLKKRLSANLGHLINDDALQASAL